MKIIFDYTRPEATLIGYLKEVGDYRTNLALFPSTEFNWEEGQDLTKILNPFNGKKVQIVVTIIEDEEK